ncbi:MAG: tellurite methyltransferase [Patiriisocius sp.]|jgi:ubiquinone/menaquinone biosynthesis C-methylase UbiE
MQELDFRTLTQHTDIYLIDQIFKNRYLNTDKILDAGAGLGRNLPWFFAHGFEVYAVDKDPEMIAFLKELYPSIAPDIQVCALENLPFRNNNFHHIICCAVLHFAENKEHFIAMFTELVRVLKPTGSLFIRMATTLGVETTCSPLEDGMYRLKDETNRFLLTKDLLDRLMNELDLEFLEPFKTTVVEDVRSMSTLVLGKR